MKMFTVEQLNGYIKEALEGSGVFEDLWVAGEISDFKRASAGHIYFTLKDQASSLRCVIWRQQAARLTWAPQPGDLAEAHGSITVYLGGGYYQLRVDQLLHGGLGRLWAQFMAIKERLEAEGLFAEERKRALPAWPRRIGVVTSESGAAWQDILNVLRQRNPLVEVILAHSAVQGDEAPAAIVAALNALNATGLCDVIIVARGGGSPQDLWAFNDEAVVRAVANSPTPVISGVGHDTDFTIIDYAADYRAPTPTAAAVAAVPDLVQISGRLEQLRGMLDEMVTRNLAGWRELVRREQRALAVHNPLRRMQEQRQQVDMLRQRAEASMANYLALQRQRLQVSIQQLRSLDVQHVLERGYALVYKGESQALVTSISQLVPPEAITLRLADGTAQASVTRTEPKEP